MKKVENSITIAELFAMAKSMYGNFVKGVVDIERSLLVVDVEMHADAEQFLLQAGSQQQDLWGINLYPEKFGSHEFIEFDSMINIRPRQHNMSRNVEDARVRDKITVLVAARCRP